MKSKIYKALAEAFQEDPLMFVSLALFVIGVLGLVCAFFVWVALVSPWWGTILAMFGFSAVVGFFGAAIAAAA